MNKGLKGFLFGLFVLVVGFVLTVLVMGSINNRSFIDEIKSWGDSSQESVIEDETTEDTETDTSTETSAMIYVA